jgi:hypothetical protein
MSALPIVILAYYFAFVSYVYDHILVVGPVALAVWLLLFVPARSWSRLRSVLTRPIATPVQQGLKAGTGPSSRRRTRPTRELRDSLKAEIPIQLHDRPLDHAR